MSNFLEIPLSRGMFAKVSPEDFEKLSAYKWHITTTGYACRKITVNGKVTSILMHREIMGAKDGQYVDHMDHDQTNNMRSNLRFATSSQNLRNRKVNHNSKTGYKGVDFNTTKGMFRAVIHIDGKQKHIGTYKTAVDAAHAYNEMAKLHFKEFAFLNELPEDFIPLETRLISSNTSGEKDISWHVGHSKWSVHIRVNHKLNHVGYFDLMEEAIKARNDCYEYLKANPEALHLPKEEKISSRNTTGFTGVSYHRHRKKFYAQKRLNGKPNFLGFFNTAEEASEAYERFMQSHTH